MRFNPLTLFILKVFVLLPACYWVWYNTSQFATWITTGLTEQLLLANFPQLVYGVEQQGNQLDIITKIIPPQLNMPDNKAGEIIFSVNPLNYNFGLPLCLALILSSPGNIHTIGRNIIISLPILFLIQIWGVYFTVLKIIFIDLSSYLNKQVLLSSLQMDFIAISYQLGTLILPAVTPLVIWLALYRKFLSTLAPALYGNI